MALIQFQIPEENISLKDLANAVAIVMKELQWAVNGNLSVMNIKANGIEAKNIKAGSVTADKIDVDQLSAITADMGTLTAGIIYGAYIATANGTYPRIDFSSVGNLLTAYFNASNHLDIIPDLLGVPAIQFTKASLPIASLSSGGSLALSGSGISIDIISTIGVNLVSLSGNLAAQSAAGFIPDIVTAINSKAPKGLAGTKTYWVSNTSGGAVTRKLTFTDGILTSET